MIVGLDRFSFNVTETRSKNNKNSDQVLKNKKRHYVVIRVGPKQLPGMYRGEICKAVAVWPTPHLWAVFILGKYTRPISSLACRGVDLELHKMGWNPTLWEFKEFWKNFTLNYKVGLFVKCEINTSGVVDSGCTLHAAHLCNIKISGVKKLEVDVIKNEGLCWEKLAVSDSSRI